MTTDQLLIMIVSVTVAYGTCLLMGLIKLVQITNALIKHTQFAEALRAEQQAHTRSLNEIWDWLRTGKRGDM